MAFINLTGTEAGTIILTSLATIAFATYKIINEEKGSTRLWWLLGIYCLPPIVAFIYIIRISMLPAAHQSQTIDSTERD